CLPGGTAGARERRPQRHVLGWAVREVDDLGGRRHRRAGERRPARDDPGVPDDDGREGGRDLGPGERPREDLGADPRRITHDDGQSRLHPDYFFQVASMSERNRVFSASDRLAATASSYTLATS